MNRPNVEREQAASGTTREAPLRFNFHQIAVELAPVDGCSWVSPFAEVTLEWLLVLGNTVIALVGSLRGVRLEGGLTGVRCRLCRSLSMMGAGGILARKLNKRVGRGSAFGSKS